MSALPDLHALQRITHNRRDQMAEILSRPGVEPFRREQAKAMATAWSVTLEDINVQISALLREAVDA